MKKSSLIKKRQRLVKFSAIALLALFLRKDVSAQLKIGADARNLKAPKVTLLDLSVDPDAAVGKGFNYPNVTFAQREQMKIVNGGTLPNGMTIFNTTSNVLQIFSADPAINDWLSYQSLRSELVTMVSSNLNTAVSPDVKTYKLTSTRNLTPSGKAFIIYNHIPLKKGVDFTIDEVAKTITFVNLIPEEFAGFTQFELEYNF